MPVISSNGDKGVVIYSFKIKENRKKIDSYKKKKCPLSIAS